MKSFNSDGAEEHQRRGGRTLRTPESGGRGKGFSAVFPNKEHWPGFGESSVSLGFIQHRSPPPTDPGGNRPPTGYQVLQREGFCLPLRHLAGRARGLQILPDPPSSLLSQREDYISVWGGKVPGGLRAGQKQAERLSDPLCLELVRTALGMLSLHWPRGLSPSGGSAFQKEEGEQQHTRGVETRRIKAASFQLFRSHVCGLWMAHAFSGFLTFSILLSLAVSLRRGGRGGGEGG